MISDGEKIRSYICFLSEDGYPYLEPFDNPFEAKRFQRTFGGKYIKPDTIDYDAYKWIVDNVEYLKAKGIDVSTAFEGENL